MSSEEYDYSGISRYTVEHSVRESVEAFATTLKEPEKRSCHLFRYYRSMMSLMIVIYNPETNNNLYLHFSTVRYYEGPTSWKGAVLRLEPYDNAIQFLDAILQKQGDVRDPRDDLAALFTFGSSTTVITKILGWDISISDTPDGQTP